MANPPRSADPVSRESMHADVSEVIPAHGDLRGLGPATHEPNTPADAGNEARAANPETALQSRDDPGRSHEPPQMPMLVLLILLQSQGFHTKFLGQSGKSRLNGQKYLEQRELRR